MEPHASSSQLPPPPPSSPLPTATKLPLASEISVESAPSGPNPPTRTVEGALHKKPVDFVRKEKGALTTGQGEFDRTRSYRDAVLRPRTFRPRFPLDSSHRSGQRWLHENNWRKGSRAVNSVWGRLGARDSRAPSIFDRLSTKPSPAGRSGEESHMLCLLKAKAGVRCCFNCFATDHRISFCRDPPRCLVCSRSGHKARFCPRRRATSPGSSVLRQREGVPEEV